jgi:hypothetical protein
VEDVGLPPVNTKAQYDREQFKNIQRIFPEILNSSKCSISAAYCQLT